MAKLGVAEVTRHYANGKTRTGYAQIRSSDAGMHSPWFEVDREWYFWPTGTQKGTVVEYRPARVPYHRMTAVLIVSDYRELERDSEAEVSPEAGDNPRMYAYI